MDTIMFKFDLRGFLKNLVLKVSLRSMKMLITWFFAPISSELIHRGIYSMGGIMIYPETKTNCFGLFILEKEVT